MRKSGFLVFVLLILAALSVSYFGLSTMAQEAEPLLLFTRGDLEVGDGELYVLNAATGEERLVTELTGFADAGWSPDGRIWVVEMIENEFARRLRFFDAQTGEESSFDDRLHHDNCYPRLYWSPNGQQMAYVSTTGDEFFLNLQNLADGSSYQMAMDEHDRITWSPDSQYLHIGMIYDPTASPIVSANDGSILTEIKDFIDFSPDSRYFSYLDAENHLQLYEIATGESIALGDTQSGQWSATGRYFMSINVPHINMLSYYDTQSQSLQSIGLDFRAKFEGWSTDESAILLSTHFVVYEGEERSTQLLRYELASGAIETILDLSGEGWIGSVHQNGEWMAIRYSPTAPEGSLSPTTEVLMFSENRNYSAELAVVDGWPRPSIASLDGGFLIDAEAGLYRFDNETELTEGIYFRPTRYPFWSPDERYIAFIAHHEEENLNILNIWDSESHNVSHQIRGESIGMIIGWQGSSMSDSLLYCGKRTREQ